MSPFGDSSRWYGSGFKVVVKHPCIPPQSFETAYINAQIVQVMLGGQIEVVELPELADKGIALLINDEGKNLRMAPNIEIPGVSLLVGPLVFLGLDGLGNFMTLNDKQLEFLDTWFDTVSHAKART